MVNCTLITSVAIMNVVYLQDIYDQMPSQLNQSSKPSSSLVPSIPPHSLVAFGLFLRLPGYAEVLLKERRKAQCLLRLVLGVTDDGEGGHILTSSVASSLPTLPFHVLKTLFDGTPLRTDDGVLLRRMTLEIGAVHLVLACLSVLSHHAPRVPIPGFHQEVAIAMTFQGQLHRDMKVLGLQLSLVWPIEYIIGWLPLSPDSCPIYRYEI